MALVANPTATTTISQNFFIEALGGSQHPVSYLDRFPDAVYTKALDSLLVKFLYAIMGPTGVGLLRQQYLEARLLMEEAGLQTTQLDSLYANAFSFARAAYETYQIDADAALLSASDRAQVLAQDASFRNRAMDFLKGARGGTTLQGLTLVAKSGLNRPVELVENYRSLFDHYTDAPMGLNDVGQTSSVSEVIVVPRQTNPQSAIQKLTITGSPVSGWFSLTYPSGQQWLAIPYSSTGNGIITVPDASRFPAGVFVTLTNLPAQSSTASVLATNVVLYAESLGGSGTTVSLGQTLRGTEGTPATIPAGVATGATFMALVGISQTTPLPYNASAANVQNALSALPVIQSGNVIVTGGPFPDRDIFVQFANQLSDRSVPSLSFNLSEDVPTGVARSLGSGLGALADASGNTLTVSANVTQTTVGISADNQATSISDADRAYLYAALNQTKLVTSLFTTALGTSETVRRQVTGGFTASNRVEVIRYETGRAIQWPPRNATHWIEAGVEHEAPTMYGSSAQYQGFHNILNSQAYTELALNDSGYASGTTNVNSVYWNSLIGKYSPFQLSLYPGLAALNPGNDLNQYLPADAGAPQAEPLVITTQRGVNVINQAYPVDYMTVPGVTQPSGGLLWASQERVGGIDYLEVDFGQIQAVNYLYFEATSKPYVIDVAYDTLGQPPARNFLPVMISAPSVGPSVLSLNYRATQLWSTVSINFGDAIGGMIYTRYLRIGFTKTPVGTVYQPVGQPGHAYSIEVRNLRIARNVTWRTTTIASMDARVDVLVILDLPRLIIRIWMTDSVRADPLEDPSIISPE